MRILHRSVAVFLAGVALGAGASDFIRRLQDKRLPPSSEAQALPIPALTSPLSLQGEPLLGDSSAPLTIVEFSDFGAATAVAFTTRCYQNSRVNTLIPDSSALSTKISLYRFTPTLCRQQQRHAVRANKTDTGTCTQVFSTTKTA